MSDSEAAARDVFMAAWMQWERQRNHMVAEGYWEVADE